MSEIERDNLLFQEVKGFLKDHMEVKDSMKLYFLIPELAQDQEEEEYVQLVDDVFVSDCSGVITEVIKSPAKQPRAGRVPAANDEMPSQLAISQVCNPTQDARPTEYETEQLHPEHEREEYQPLPLAQIPASSSDSDSDPEYMAHSDDSGENSEVVEMRRHARKFKKRMRDTKSWIGMDPKAPIPVELISNMEDQLEVHCDHDPLPTRTLSSPLHCGDSGVLRAKPCCSSHQRSSSASRSRSCSASAPSPVPCPTSSPPRTSAASTTPSIVCPACRRGSLCSSSRHGRQGHGLPRRRWFCIAVSDIISPAVPPGEVLYFLGASGSSFLFAANGRRELVVVDLSAQSARQLLPVRRRRSPTVRAPLSRPPKLMAQRAAGALLRRPLGLAPPTAPRALSTSAAAAEGEAAECIHRGAPRVDLSLRVDDRHITGYIMKGDVYPVEPYESLSVNQVLDAHWGILDDEDVVVWFSTGYIGGHRHAHQDHWRCRSQGPAIF
ncbi:hypothetical protein ZWY2020_009885 [Hordeum vulgare]|nr:hypothetical protein ZWY2020_009885 [Hordeum vulgare]